MMREVLFAAVLALPAVAAGDTNVDVALTARGDAFFTGTMDGTLNEVGHLYTSENATPGAVLLRGYVAAGTFELWDRPYVEGATWGGSPLGLNEYRVSQEPRIVEEGPLSGDIIVSTMARPHIAAWTTESSKSVHHLGSLQVSHVDDARLDGTIPPDVLPRELADALPRGAAWSPAPPRDEPLHVDGLVLWGVRLAAGGQDFETGPRNGTAHAADPLGWSGAGEVHQYFLVLRVSAGEFEPVGPGWTVVASGFHGRLEGDLEVRRVVATGEVAGAGLSQDNHIFQAIGDFTAFIEHGETSSNWELAGEASFVGADAVTVAGDRFAHLGPVVAAGGLALLALAWLWFSESGRALLHFVVGRTGADARRRAVECIGEQPGITTAQLARSLGVKPQTAAYHVRRLQRAGTIETLERGGSHHHVLNRGSHSFAAVEVLGARGPTAAHAYACLQEPTRRRIIELLIAIGAASTAELEAALGDGAPSRRLLNHHLAALADAGLVRRERRGREVVNEAVVDLVQLESRRAANLKRLPPPA